MAKKLRKLEIQELILIKTGRNWCKTYMGEIKRQIDESGNSICRGEVIVEEGKIWSMAETEDELGDNLDEICEMKLYFGLHLIPAITTTICETPFNLN